MFQAFMKNRQIINKAFMNKVLELNQFKFSGNNVILPNKVKTS